MERLVLHPFLIAPPSSAPGTGGVEIRADRARMRTRLPICARTFFQLCFACNSRATCRLFQSGSLRSREKTAAKLKGASSFKGGRKRAKRTCNTNLALPTGQFAHLALTPALQASSDHRWPARCMSFLLSFLLVVTSRYLHASDLSSVQAWKAARSWPFLIVRRWEGSDNSPPARAATATWRSLG
jgi:hypothetical protein